MKTIKNDKILVAGLMVMDVVVKPVDASLFETDTSFPESISFLTGGDALNVAIDLRKLGADVTVSGLVGNDAGGDLILREFNRRGINCGLVESRSGVDTTVSIVMCRPDGERNFICHADSTYRYDAANLNDEVLDRFGALYIGSVMALPALEKGRLADLLARAKAKGLLTGMDATHSPDGVWLPKVIDALPYTDIFIPSFIEAVQITGKSDPTQAAAFLREKGAGIAGVKLGADGCYIDDGETPFFLPAIPCPNPVDLTGAGDSFMAGFIFGKTRGWPTRECAKFATVVSSYCIRYLGASSYPITYEEARRTMEKSAAILEPGIFKA